MPQQLSIKSKLIIILLTLSLTSLAIMGYLNWRTSQDALFQVMRTHLTSVRTAQAHQVEGYFDVLHSQIRTLAESEMTVSAMAKLKSGFRELEQTPVATKIDEAIEEYYVESYLPALASTTQGSPSFGVYEPTSNAERHLQYQYLVKNGVSLGLDNHTNQYTKWHRHYHNLLQNVAAEFGYVTLLLIDHETSEVIYATRKNPIVGTNLSDGPYRQSNLAQVVEAVQLNPEKGVIQSADFAPFRPDLSEPAAFLASAIYAESQIVGIIAIQLSIDQISELMPSHLEWAEVGLGKTGDTYLVGADLRMRSFSRHLQSRHQIEQLAMPSIVPLTDVETLTALADPVTALPKSKLAALSSIMAGETSTSWISNYLGNDVLSAYAPLDVDGVDWTILTEMEASEIMQPVYYQQRLFLITLATLTLATSVLIILFAQLFVQPISRLTSGVQQVVNGELDASIKLHGNDEFTHLSERINELVTQMSTQVEIAREKDRSYESLLNMLVPNTVAKQLQQNKVNYGTQQIVVEHSTSKLDATIRGTSNLGRPQIVNRVKQVTVLVATLVDLDPINEKWSPNAVNQLLSEFASRLHEASQRYGLDAPLFQGNQVLAVCGLTTPRLDHAKRTVDFAQEIMVILKWINERFQTELRLQIGIHSGSMTAGILGDQLGVDWFQYNLWGSTMNTATQLSRNVGPNVIVVSQPVHERVEQAHKLVAYRKIDTGEGEPIRTWALASSLRMPQEQIALIQNTFAKLLPVTDEVAQAFYNHLFELDPDLRPFFKSDMMEQRRKLMATLQVVIGGLSSPEKIIPTAQDLGRRHVAYGVRDAHYDTVGEALLRSLADSLAEDFTLPVREAWSEMYDRISSAMRVAAADQAGNKSI